MLRRHTLCTILALLVLSIPAWGAKPEFRAAWVTAWSSGILTPAEVDETIRMAREANMNALIVQVRKTGDALYKSNYEPRAPLDDPNFDPLAYLVEKAHKEGIEIHAWLNTFRITARGEKPGPGHVLSLHPEWANKTYEGSTEGGEGGYLDPGIPGVQDWTVNVFVDVVRNYDIDGIHFDYVRYPGANWGYSDLAVAQFNKEQNRTGKPTPNDLEWKQWRRDQVTKVVRRVYWATKRLKPKVKVTASLIPWGRATEDFRETSAYNSVYQDWEAWAREGILDALIPMNYSHGDTFQSWLDGMKRWRAGRHAYTGMSASTGRPRFWGEEFCPPGPPVPASEVPMIQEIKAARETGVDGISIFAFNAGDNRAQLVKLLRENVFQEPAPVPEMPWLGQTELITQPTQPTSEPPLF